MLRLLASCNILPQAGRLLSFGQMPQPRETPPQTRTRTQRPNARRSSRGSRPTGRVVVQATHHIPVGRTHVCGLNLPWPKGQPRSIKLVSCIEIVYRVAHASYIETEFCVLAAPRGPGKTKGPPFYTIHSGSSVGPISPSVLRQGGVLSPHVRRSRSSTPHTKPGVSNLCVLTVTVVLVANSTYVRRFNTNSASKYNFNCKGIGECLDSGVSSVVIGWSERYPLYGTYEPLTCNSRFS